MGRGYRSLSGRFVIDLIDSIDWPTTFEEKLKNRLGMAESMCYDLVAEPPECFRDSRQVSETKGTEMTKSATKSAPKSAPAPEVTLYSVAQSDAMERFRKSAVAVKSAALECVRFACAMIDAGVHTVRGEEPIATILSLAKVHTDTSTAYYIRDLASARLAAPAAFETIAAKSLDAVRAIATRTDGDAEAVRANLESVAQAIKADPKVSAKDALAKSATLRPTKSERKAAESRPTGTDLKARLAKCAHDGCSGNYSAAIEALKGAIEQLERESAHAARIAKSA